MGKRASLFHQLLTSLKTQMGIVQPAPEAVNYGDTAPAWVGNGTERPDIRKFIDYKQVAHDFAAWASPLGVRYLTDALPLAGEYLKLRISRSSRSCGA